MFFRRYEIVRRAAVCAALIICAAPLYAETAANGEIGNGASWRFLDGKFIQRLSWPADPNVLRYEAAVETEDGRVVEKYKTTDPFVEVSLPHGRYRYIVDVYNRLDILEYSMPPVEFEVFAALQPAVSYWMPRRLDAAAGKTELTITGRNIVAGSRIYLSGKDGGKAEPVEFEAAANGGVARVLFSPDELEHGSWTLNIENPGGLRTQVAGLKIGYGAVFIDLSGVYGPVVPLKGSYLSNVFTSGFYYAGAGAKLAWTPFRYKTLGFGFTLEPFWTNIQNSISNSEKQYENINAQLFGINAAFLFKKSFFENKFSLNITLGAGAVSLIGVHFEQSNERTQNAVIPCSAAGLFLKFSPFSPFFLEAGASFYATFPFDTLDMFYLRPQIGIGLSF